MSESFADIQSSHFLAYFGPLLLFLYAGAATAVVQN